MPRRCLPLPLGLLPVLFLFGCGGGSGSPPPPPIALSIVPAQKNVAAGSSTLFTASVTGTANQAVTWSVSGTSCSAAACGTIGSTGLYTAPASVPTPSAGVTVKAVSQADSTKSATATVTVTVAVSVSPNPVNTVFPGNVQQFTATVTGNSNTAVTWEVNGIPGGSAASGLISSTGFYTAPDLTPFPPLVTVSAVAQFDNTSGSESVPIGALNQEAQNLPIPLGTSGGNEKDISAQFCCSGTLGALIVDHSGNFYVLSNDHVLGLSGSAQPGDPVDEPGLVDTNCSPATLVAKFTKAAPLQNGGVDAAIAQIVSGKVDTTGPIMQLGAVSSTTGIPQPAPPANTVLAPSVNLPIAKSGRTSGLTCGSITSTNTSVQVDYSSTCGGPTTKTVTYTNQVITSSNFTEAGDSGSLIVDAQTAQPVALLFAGDPTNASAVGNPIQQVLAAFPDSHGNLPTIVGTTAHPVSACPNSAAAALSAKKFQAITPVDIATAVVVKDRHAQQLMADPAVVAVGVGAGSATGQVAIIVYVERNKLRRPIPPVLDGLPTRVIQGGRFIASDWDEKTARRCSQKRQTSFRPWVLDGEALSFLP